ncbi:MAG: holo-[acyl-carrier-protein] synthase [Phycisphaerales bacterium]|nr:holo-[acyl-carrier-protein] synthase [Phycisphaerales bacterium]
MSAPTPFRVGIDLIEISRIEKLLTEHGERFAERVYTEAERAYCETGGQQRSARYAARFAVKEAVMKALGTGLTIGFAWTDVETVRAANGAPSIALHGGAKAEAERLGIKGWSVSLTHARELAGANVICWT